MIEIGTLGEEPVIIINNKKVPAWYIDPVSDKVVHNQLPKIGLNNDFSGTQELSGIQLWDIIKNENVDDLPKGVRLSIDRIHYNGIPPLDRLPYPFWSVSFENDGEEFHTLFSAVASRDDYGEEHGWDKKWTIDFYFKGINKYNDIEGVEVLDSNNFDDSFEELSVVVKTPSKDTFENNFCHAIRLLSKLLDRVELGLKGLNDVFELSQLWDKRATVKNEKIWQDILKSNSWVLSLAFSQPLIIFDNESYLGGKSIKNSGGRIVDFAYKNNLTNSLFIIEIKTPHTLLLGRKYRDTYSLSKELSGSVNQTLSYLDSLSKEYYALRRNSDNSFDYFSAKGLIVIGSLMELDRDRRKAFELFRNSTSKIEIITFDELFEKIFMILRLIN